MSLGGKLTGTGQGVLLGLGAVGAVDEVQGVVKDDGVVEDPQHDAVAADDQIQQQVRLGLLGLVGLQAAPDEHEPAAATSSTQPS